MKRRILWSVTVVSAMAILGASFAAGSYFRGRRMAQVEEARTKFFEAAQGQFHWPDGSKEWTEMLVPLGSVDFSEFGERWRFTAMYEGAQSKCDVNVIVRDTKGTKRDAITQTLDRAVPEEIELDLGQLRKNGLDLHSVKELALRMRGNGKAGRLLVAGMVNPRPALIRQTGQP